MRIDEIDKNLKVETKIQKEDIVWISARTSPISIHGLCEVEGALPYHRIPQAVAEKTNEGVAQLMWHTAGGRIRFSTNSPYIAVKVMKNACEDAMPHITRAGQSGFDLYCYQEGRQKYCGTFMPPVDKVNTYEACLNVSGDMCTYNINMPLYDRVSEVYIGLAAGAELLPAAVYKWKKPVLYYGSSITQGGCASRPGNSYQGFIERRLETDYINLGFSGSARGEKAMCEYLATLDASVFVCDYDHNAPTAAYLRQTHYTVYKTYRDAHPDTPILLLSKPDFRGDAESVERRSVIYDTYLKARENGDKQVYFLDGEQLFAGAFRDCCTVDGCHPNDLGFFRMGQVIGEAIEKILCREL